LQHQQARARLASGEVRTRLWQRMAAIYPAFDTYQARAAREFPVAVLESA
jgi:proline iminopeptidase